jgi:hypothetical protein
LVNSLGACAGEPVDNGGGTVVNGNTGCAGLQSCCARLDAEQSQVCNQALQGAMVGGDAACSLILGTYQQSQVCP